MIRLPADDMPITGNTNRPATAPLLTSGICKLLFLPSKARGTTNNPSDHKRSVKRQITNLIGGTTLMDCRPHYAQDF